MDTATGGTPGVERLNRLSRKRAEAELLECCGSTAWARSMAAARPFADVGELLETADRSWWALEPPDWLEAFRAHPRIGERKPVAAAGDRSARWSEQEQSAARSAESGVLAELEAGNREYEERFGHVFLICATGRSAEEMLSALRDRLRNHPETELRVAAEEQQKITRIRLRKLLDPAGST